MTTRTPARRRPGRSRPSKRRHNTRRLGGARDRRGGRARRARRSAGAQSFVSLPKRDCTWRGPAAQPTPSRPLRCVPPQPLCLVVRRRDLRRFPAPACLALAPGGGSLPARGGACCAEVLCSADGDGDRGGSRACGCCGSPCVRVLVVGMRGDAQATWTREIAVWDGGQKILSRRRRGGRRRTAHPVDRRASRRDDPLLRPPTRTTCLLPLGSAEGGRRRVRPGCR